MDQQVITDPSNPNFGMPVTASSGDDIDMDPTSPTFGMPKKAKPTQPSALERFGSGIKETLIDPILSGVKSSAEMLMDPETAMRKMGDAGGAEGGRLYDLAQKGNAGKSALNWLPIVGPGLARTADKMRSGNYAGAAGDMVGMAAPTVVSGVMGAAGRGMQDASVNLEGRLLKPKLKTVQSTAEFKATGDKLAGQNALARTNLEQGTGRFGSTNVAKGRASLETLDDLVTNAIDNSQQTVPKASAQQALMDHFNSIGVGSAGQAAERDAVLKAFKEVDLFPSQVPVQMLQKAKRAIYSQRNYATTAPDQAAASVDKMLGRTYRADIAKAEPSIEPLNAEMSRRIPAQSALEDATFRAGKHNPVGLSQMLALASGKAGPIVGGLLNHPTIGSFTAQRGFNAGKMLSRATLDADAQRALIMAMLAQQEK